jgi:catechol 2,3-dioxygenase-like lactoylglutathione lyase family enzyme
MGRQTMKPFGLPIAIRIDSNRPRAHCLFRKLKGGLLMSRIFGEMRQIAFVVRDLEKTLDYWTRTLGVGPFFMMREIVPDNYRYRGKPVPPPRVSIALGFSGEFQVEIIQQHDDNPSAYRDYLGAGHEGFQHVSSWMTRAEYDRAVPELVRSGLSVAHEGAIPGSGLRFIYFATDSMPGGPLYEISEAREPSIYPTMMKIRDLARGWDGRDPIRDFANLMR